MSDNEKGGDYSLLLKEYYFEKRFNKLIRKYSGKKIVLYGTGSFCQYLLEKFDFGKFDILGISDVQFHKNHSHIDENDFPELKLSDDKEYAGYKAISPFEIFDYKPDVVMITIINSFELFLAEKQLHICSRALKKRIKYIPVVKFPFYKRVQLEWEVERDL